MPAAFGDVHVRDERVHTALGGEHRARQVGGGDVGIAGRAEADERGAGDSPGDHGGGGSEPSPSRAWFGSCDRRLYTGLDIRHAAEYLEAEVLAHAQRGVPERPARRATRYMSIERGGVLVVGSTVERLREALGRLVTAHRLRPSR